MSPRWALLVLVASLLGCSKKADVPRGRLELGLSASGGVVVDLLRYEVTAATGGTLAVGDIDVSNGSATTTLSLSLPEGVGDSVSLAAFQSRPPFRLFQGMSAPFNIVAGQTTTVEVVLTDNPAVPLEGGPFTFQPFQAPTRSEASFDAEGEGLPVVRSVT